MVQRRPTSVNFAHPTNLTDTLSGELNHRADADAATSTRDDPNGLKWLLRNSFRDSSPYFNHPIPPGPHHAKTSL